VRIAVIPGDGIGPEVIAEAAKILDAVGGCERHHLSWGADHYLATGETVPPAATTCSDRSMPSWSVRLATRVCPTIVMRATSCSARASSSICSSTIDRFIFSMIGSAAEGPHPR
jgi:hypothetical protein